MVSKTGSDTNLHTAASFSNECLTQPTMTIHAIPRKDHTTLYSAIEGIPSCGRERLEKHNLTSPATLNNTSGKDPLIICPQFLYLRIFSWSIYRPLSFYLDARRCTWPLTAPRVIQPDRDRSSVALPLSSPRHLCIQNTHVECNQDLGLALHPFHAPGQS